jgi:hypothetical protein
MEIQEIKSKIAERPWEYDLEMSAALVRAIDYLQDAAKLYNVPEGQRAIACLRVIENCFVEE